jgi:hypothetical protein
MGHNSLHSTEIGLTTLGGESPSSIAYSGREHQGITEALRHLSISLQITNFNFMIQTLINPLKIKTYFTIKFCYYVKAFGVHTFLPSFCTIVDEINSVLRGIEAILY